MDPNKDTGPRKALGRGLAALIPNSPTGSFSSPSSGLRQLPIEKVLPNREQPRKIINDDALLELAQSIKEQGVLQPILVRRKGEGYQIIAGERRWRAAAKAGLHEIPAIVKDFSDTEVLQIALIENIQRQDLDPIEEAEAYHRLINDHGLTQDEVAKAVGKSRVAVTNSLRIIRLPKDVLALLANGQFTAGHARALMSLGDDALLRKIAKDIIDRKLTVRETERNVRLAQQNNKKIKEKVSSAERNVEERLLRALGTKVRLRNRHGKGSVEIFFNSLDELDRILDKIAP
ncbi:MAG: ParB/RepB/Spo0J family partition protein [Deltaproteobacteria bacterium]|nr:ParB/RepB/Spo0J family partition protein [Deltaproteobacteria bacterium]